MKIIITESRIKDIIYSYLDNQNFYVTKDEGDYYFWESKHARETDGYVIIGVYPRRKNCYILSDLVHEIMSFFGMSIEESMDIIASWLSNKLGFDVGEPFTGY